MHPPPLSLPLAPLALALLASGAVAQCPIGVFTGSDGDYSDAFGGSVSLSGHRALVGRDGDNHAGTGSGSAFVFEEHGGLWLEMAKLTASDAATGDRFGSSVSLSGDRALIGAHGDDGAFVVSGAAYVFEKQGSMWVETAKLTASDAAPGGDQFGRAVSLSGDVALVGSLHDSGAGSISGTAYVFEKQGSTWIETAKLTASDAAPGDSFGSSVSVHGDRALVGAQLADDAFGETGAVYVFEKQGSAWIETARLIASDPRLTLYFGSSVFLASDRALVGAQGDGGIRGDTGSAYLFEKRGPAWVEAAKLTASDADADDHFGYSVALAGDRALVGAYFDEHAGLFSGSAYLFEKLGSSWIETAKLEDGGYVDLFGCAVALSGDRALVGAQQFVSSFASSGPGVVHAYSLSEPCLLGPVPGLAAASNTVKVSGATPFGLTGLAFGLGAGATSLPSLCPGLALDIEGARLIDTALANERGSALLQAFVPASLSGTTIYLQAVDVATCEITNLVPHPFP